MTVKRPGIYKIVNSVTGKCYVGSAVKLSIRERAHFQDLENQTHKNKKLQASYNKHGKKAFTFVVIQFCARELLIEREQYWMDKLQAVVKGYNLNPTAGSPLGRKFPNRPPMPEEQKQKLSVARKGKSRPPFTEEWCVKLSEVARRPRPTQSVAIRKYWANNKSPRATLICVDCSKEKEILQSAVHKYAQPYRCRDCYLIAYSAGLLTTRTVVEVSCPECGKVRDRKPTQYLLKHNNSVRCASCARKGDRNPGSRARLNLLANNLSFLAGCS